MQITDLLAPYAVLLTGLVVTLILKDIATSLAKGIMFMFNPAFKEGDKVIVDGTNAVIVKIGMKTTVFGLYKDDGSYNWRYVPNEKIPNLKIEKIITPVV